MVYHIKVPLRNDTTDNYNWYNQSSICLVPDVNGSVVEFLSLYTFDSAFYEGNQVIMLPSVSHNNQPSPLDKLLKNIGGARIWEAFTEMECHVLGCYAEGIEVNSRFQTMKDNTIYTYNKHILLKAKTIFQFSFNSAKDFGIFLKANHLWGEKHPS